jgi:hypothetical protein
MDDGPPLLPDITVDETDAGGENWREHPGHDDERILREVPPHHVG